MGELLERIEPQQGGDRTSKGGRPPVDRKSAATEAGLSEHQRKTALRITYACHWGTAAITYAWTEDARGRRTDLSGKADKLSLKEFAALGIRGLTRAETVSAYRKAWQLAIDAGLVEPVEPGATSSPLSAWIEKNPASVG